MPLSVSVITPSFNHAEFIERTVRSVLDQHYAPLDYVVCDGQSTDATLEILEPYRDRITIISEPDAGQAAAVNKGIGRTSGEIIGWLNSDDVYAASALRTASAYFEAHPEVDVVYGDAQLVDGNDQVTGMYYTEPWRPSRLPERCILSQPAAFFRRRVVRRFGLLDERLHYCLDYEYWLRLSRGGAIFAYLPTTLAAWRLHPEAKSVSARLAVHQELNGMLRTRLGRVPNTWLLNHAHTLVELRRGRRHRFEPVPYAVEVVLTAIRLSLEWNGSVNSNLLKQALGPVVAGASRRLRRSALP